MHHPEIIDVEVFDYPESGKARPCFWEDLSHAAPAGALKPVRRPASAGCPVEPGAVPLSEESQHAFDLGREQGIREGREQEQAAQKAKISEIETRYITQAANLARQVAQKQEEFFDAVEQDLVRLALVIAERILRREAQIDPLFLVGAVRVALGQLAKSMHVRLRVPAADAELWRQTMAHIPNLKIRPEVVPDQAMQPGDCMVESEMGSVDLGLPAQLNTMRRTLLDHQPASAQPPTPGRNPANQEARS